LLYFGVLRDVLGGSDEWAELPEGATVGDLLGLLRARTSNSSMNNAGQRSASETNRGLDEGLWRSLAVAVNREYGSLAVVLRDGDEVALLPPVSGGVELR
jgi:molybdopterin converting factor small subunit